MTAQVIPSAVWVTLAKVSREFSGSMNGPAGCGIDAGRVSRGTPSCASARRS